MAGPHPLKDDLDRLVTQTGALWPLLDGKSVFLTGGSGFFGKWLLESLLWAIDRLDLAVAVTVLARTAKGFERAPHLLQHPSVEIIHGDVRDFPFPSRPYDLIIHAAASAVGGRRAANGLLLWQTTVDGTRRVLNFARQCGAPRVLLTSSGAVYGEQAPCTERLGEEDGGRLDPSASTSTYAEAKRAAEQLARLYFDHHGIETVVARCFTFVGPYLPADASFAVTDFIRDALRGGPIRVRSDGTAVRSYMYAGDLAAWLWTLALHGSPVRPYNVGSDEPITIADLASRVARSCTPPGSPPLQAVLSPAEGAPSSRYVPAIDRARSELGLRIHTPLEEALLRTIRWCSANYSP